MDIIDNTVQPISTNFPTSPQFNPTSPYRGPPSPPYDLTSPQFNPTSPRHGSTSPQFDFTINPPDPVTINIPMSIDPLPYLPTPQPYGFQAIPSPPPSSSLSTQPKRIIPAFLADLNIMRKKKKRTHIQMTTTNSSNNTSTSLSSSSTSSSTPGPIVSLLGSSKLYFVNQTPGYSITNLYGVFTIGEYYYKKRTHNSGAQHVKLMAISDGRHTQCMVESLDKHGNLIYERVKFDKLTTHAPISPPPSKKPKVSTQPYPSPSPSLSSNVAPITSINPPSSVVAPLTPIPLNTSSPLFSSSPS
jgi:hypothetical protein